MSDKRFVPMGDNAVEKIAIRKRTAEEMEAYNDGFRAGVKMCQEAIGRNAERYLAIIKLAEMESE